MSDSEKALYDRLIQDIDKARHAEKYYRAAMVKNPASSAYLNEIIERLEKDIVAMQDAAESIRRGISQQGTVNISEP